MASESADELIKDVLTQSDWKVFANMYDDDPSKFADHKEKMLVATLESGTLNGAIWVIKSVIKNDPVLKQAVPGIVIKYARADHIPALIDFNNEIDNGEYRVAIERGDIAVCATLATHGLDFAKNDSYSIAIKNRDCAMIVWLFQREVAIPVYLYKELFKTKDYDIIYCMVFECQMRFTADAFKCLLMTNNLRIITLVADHITGLTDSHAIEFVEAFAFEHCSVDIIRFLYDKGYAIKCDPIGLALAHDRMDALHWMHSYDMIMVNPATCVAN